MGQIVINILVNGSFYALLALSFNFLLGTTKFFDVAHGARALASAYIFLLSFKVFHLPIILSLIFAIVAAIIIGILSDKFIYSSLRKKKASSLVLLVASFGIFIAIQALLPIFFTSQFQTISLPAAGQIFSSPLGVVTYIQFFFIISVPVIFISLQLFLKKFSLGKAIAAVGSDEEIASISGINTSKINLFVISLSSAIASFAVIFSLFDVGIDPAQGLNIILKTIIAAIIGGVGSISGGFLGGYFLGTAENVVVWFWGVEWIDATAFLLLILFLIIRPQGILGKK